MTFSSRSSASEAQIELAIEALRRRWWRTAVAMIAALLVVAALTVHAFRTEVRRHAVTDLAQLRDAVGAALDAWGGANRQTAEVWAQDTEVVELTRELLRVTPEGNALLESPEQAQLRRLMASVMRSHAYQGFFVISADGLNLASSRDENVGVPTLLGPQRDFFDLILAGQSAMSRPVTSDVPLPHPETGQLVSGLPTMFAGAPIRDESGEILGTLTFRISPFEEYSEIFAQGRLGRTGEVVAFDRAGTLLSSSRFEAELRDQGRLTAETTSALHLRLSASPEARPEPALVEAVRRAVAGEVGTDSEGSPGYRDADVLSAWKWDAVDGIGLAAFQDVAEVDARAGVPIAGVVSFTLLGMILIVALARSAVQRQTTVLERDREMMQTLEDRLNEALERALTGLVPICASCKNIRGDEDKWVPVEVHLAARTEARFSHGFCPDCLEKLYGDDLRS